MTEKTSHESDHTAEHQAEQRTDTRGLVVSEWDGEAWIDLNGDEQRAALWEAFPRSRSFE